MLLANEILQIRKQKMSYLKEYWNYFDLVGFVLYLIYFCMRMSDPTRKMIPKDDTAGSTGMIVGWIFLNSFMLLNSVIKLMFFMRVFVAFGMLVQLVLTVLQDVVNFTIYFICWVFLMI